ncbi:hypothetical protein [Streptomyces sp. Amel2xC10]|uniref:hypothetical protein n=1 Tax=Streptomyces sp. Amel2xC10 TaxID=1305826 RepID=UPI000A087F5E|nr:hypothetical protein [Streptomyces sp. Amel2xC10]SME89178.1 hypothetical protein SAMN02745830_00173 [Streptomyces sp. Amel2xC10]
MRQAVVDAAVRFPDVIWTSALVVSLGFWLLVLLGLAGARDFDADAPGLARSLRGVPVAVLASAVIAHAWLLGLAGSVLLDRLRLTGSAEAAARVTLLALSALLALTTTRWCVVTLAGLRSARSTGTGPRRRDPADGTPYDPGSRPGHGPTAARDLTTARGRTAARGRTTSRDRTPARGQAPACDRTAARRRSDRAA